MPPKFSLMVTGQVITLWFLITTTTAALDDIEFFNTQSNSSVQFSCDYPNKSNINPFAFNLERKWVNPTSVFYLNFALSPRALDPRLEKRILVQHDPTNKRVDVTINDVKGYDTDLYICNFHYDHQAKFHSRKSRKMFFLFVSDASFLLSDEECSSSKYKMLLFTLSAAVGLLFIIVLIFAVVYRRMRKKPTPQFNVPIYEEMSSGREKLNPNMNAEVTYAHPKKENPYIN